MNANKFFGITQLKNEAVTLADSNKINDGLNKNIKN